MPASPFQTLCLIALLSLGGNPRALGQGTAASFVEKARVAFEDGKFDAAIADFSRAIEIEPKLAEAYFQRGAARYQQGDRDGAIVDYTSALKHAVGPPSRSWKPLAFGGCCAARGAAYFEKGELADAIRDIDAAIRWLPANAKFYELRAKAKIALGDLPAATTDLSFCLALDPKIAATPQYHRDQGLVCICQRDWARALLSLRRFMELSQVNQDYAALWIYLLRVQLGEPREAPAGELTAYLRNRKPIEAGDWFPTLAAFVLGELPEPDLFAAAKSSNPAQTTGMQCEAWFYAGWQAERSGDRAAALRSYRKCIATQSVTSWEFPLARSWIPLLDRP